MRNILKINEIEALCRPSCKIKNPEFVEDMLNTFRNSGVEKLQVVSDFDFTITKQRMENGDLVPSSFNMFAMCKSFPPHCRDESKRLVEKYRPIEIDPKIPEADKFHVMVQWWKETSLVLTGFPMERHEILDVADKYKHTLRDGTHELFSHLNINNVPLLVFSAGLGDSVLAVLEKTNLMLPNVKVVSNILRYEDGILNGFDTDKMIHVFNKNESALKGTDYYEKVHDRTNIIVMGDSLGDARMANGAPSHAKVLKIGFLFDHIEENLPIYMDTFDIVLVDDQTMNVARAIVDLIKN